MKEVRRSDRVAEQLRMELAELLMRGKVRDRDARDAVISGVKVTNDLSIARVYVRGLDELDAGRQERMVAALNRAAGFLRREIGPKLRLRRTPELTFHWDELVDRVIGIERALLDIADEQKAAQRKEEEEE
ncbi:MAG: 30S ribosome-binding factor RbfA [Myxococcales bacterium]|nr:30S ribosome-binding factor RbfA [Myxococcales bacterium]